MKSMIQLAAAGGLLAVLSTIAGTTPAITPPANPQTERGRYLVLQAGLCCDCHSPRDEKGEFVESTQLTGAPLPFKPVAPMPWMPAAPRIAGMPAGYKSCDLVRFLMTGVRPNGTPPLPPMPAYRFNREDAEAITAFLQSIPTESH